VTTLTKVASLNAGLVTDGTFLPDGRMLLRGYGRLFLLDRPESVEDGQIRTLDSSSLPPQEQGESIAAATDGRQALIGSEGIRQEVLRIPVPDVPASDPPEVDTSSGPDSSSNGSSGNGSSSNGSSSDSSGASTGGGSQAEADRTASAASRSSRAEPLTASTSSLQSWAVMLAGGLTLVALTIGTLVVWTRRMR
jgi:hypothetical protein